jgi:hypothetical protein
VLSTVITAMGSSSSPVRTTVPTDACETAQSV